MAQHDVDSHTSDPPEAILEVRGLSKHFAGLVALDEVDLAVDAREIIGLIGPNGAGKTTMFNCISGTFPPSDGTVFLHGEDITGLKAHQIARKGLARTFQITRPLEELTVLENAMVGAHVNTRRRAAARQIALEKLAFVGLEASSEERADELTVGDQKRLELARAIATEPDVLLLDEIMAGLTPSETKGMLNLFRDLREEGMSLLVIEHDMAAIMDISDRIMVLDNGQGIAFGDPAVVSADERVIEAYIGGDADEFA